MSDDVGFLEWGFKGLMGLVVGGVAYITKNLHTDIVKLRDQQMMQGNDLRDHKLDAEKRYAKEDTLQSSLSRVHERIDSMNDSVNEKLDRIYQTLINKK